MTNTPLTSIEFRSQTPPPTEPGWYYGRQKYDEDIIPMKVGSYSRTGELMSYDSWTPVANIIWYGPVRQIQEASTP